MGLEARCIVRWPAGEGEAMALLEATELILRGPLRRRLPLAGLSAVRVEGEALVFEAGGERLSLALGAAQAARWQRRIATPPPSLSKKLGLEARGASGARAKVFVLGDVVGMPVEPAVLGLAVPSPDEAQTMLAIVGDAGALHEAVRLHGGRASLPIWVVHGKGRGAAFGETAVRALMREAGFIDTKVAAVSETLSAIRYSVAARRPA